MGTIRQQLEREEGHMGPFGAALVAGAGLIALGIAAATDTGWLAVVGGVGGGLAVIAYAAVHHSTIDKEFFARTDELAKK
ncbi:MAG: hypothetical protein IT303_16690 [Dehalococcoidia bacterium]|nr:hypothetical protein [Dehalococcoidia bacterium]